MQRNLLTLLIIILLTHSIYATESNTQKLGDILQVAIPAIGYGATLYLDDYEGEKQFYKSFATNLALTYALKYSINKKRPNGKDYSFPSGHTSSAFQGASFIHQRYGLEYGIPAYLGAIFVGYSRIEAEAHYPVDVVSGAFLGTISSMYFTTEYKGYKLEVKQMGSGYGLQVEKKF
ncbi:MAG: phosphatase PAP2 family protein [Sulfurovum sp.]